MAALAGLLACRGAPPVGTPGPQADARARAMMAAVRTEAWSNTGAVRFVFAGKNRHVWDRRRGFSEVVSGDRRAQLAVDRRVGIAFRGKVRLDGDEAREALDDAHAKWTNDAFWLNPVAKAFDPGTERLVVPEKDGRRGLIVRYTSGGRTPGDAYLWWLDPDDRPVAWQMWTSNIPVGGVEASWERWIELDTGALVATKHELPLFGLGLTEVAGAERLEQLPGMGESDRFAELLACLDAGSCQAF